MSKNVILWSKCKYRTVNCQGEVNWLGQISLDRSYVVSFTRPRQYVANT